MLPVSIEPSEETKSAGVAREKKVNGRPLATDAIEVILVPFGILAAKLLAMIGFNWILDELNACATANAFELFDRAICCTWVGVKNWIWLGLDASALAKPVGFDEALGKLFASDLNTLRHWDAALGDKYLTTLLANASVEQLLVPVVGGTQNEVKLLCLDKIRPKLQSGLQIRSGFNLKKKFYLII